MAKLVVLKIPSFSVQVYIWKILPLKSSHFSDCFSNIKRRRILGLFAQSKFICRPVQLTSMKTGASSLNPYAAAYVPLSKRGAADVNKDFNSTQELHNGNATLWRGHQPHNTLAQNQHKNVSQSYVHHSGASAFQTAENSKWNDHHGRAFYASSSHYPNEIPDEEFDMDLAYLQMSFPGISEESLSDVYLANSCDLDSAIDMVNQLELYPDDLSDKLPDTLDIGDVPDSSELASQKRKIVTAEASASSSASFNLSSKS
ncbi:hypothetical protein ACJIZ3_004955 [Penstemon smallii]|uniref:CUE domain-containing protein n=1 Tax=Penstemon smallii TaxID=265156 RepID=A0ABD3S3G9_9LAMI